MNSKGKSVLPEIKAAAEVIYRTLQPTPLLEHPLLNEELGLSVLVKHENHLPTGAFKVRGGLNFMHNFAAAPTHSGVITATRGNHGQSIALAAHLYGIPCTIVVPFGNNPEKNAAMRAYGARLVEHGRDFDEARLETERLSAAEDLRYVHSANETDLINGVASYALEVVESSQAAGRSIDSVFVPIGMGSGICGVINVFRELSPDTRIYGVQAEGAPSYFLSLKAGRLIETPAANTFADGVATRCPSAYALDIIVRGVTDIILVSDAEIRDAVRLLWRTAHNLAEGAGAAATAAIAKMRDHLIGQTSVSILTGGNLDTATAGQVLSIGAE